VNFPPLLWYLVSIDDWSLTDYATANITKRLQGGIGGGKVMMVESMQAPVCVTGFVQK
jgi:hypothetical protein